MKGEVTSYIDVAQIAIYTFWIFFIGLVFYLRREDRREGYPLLSEPSNTSKNPGVIWIPPPKIFMLPGGGTSMAPNGKVDDRALKAEKIAPWPGAPYEPVGNPMLAAVGPGSYAERADVPDMTSHGEPRIVPMRADAKFGIESRDPDPRGMIVIAADRKTAGTIKDVWVDRAEVIIRYLEAEVPAAGGTRRVLIPMTFSKVERTRRVVQVAALLSSQFADIPALAKPDQVTLLEEDKIVGYFGAGTLYATPQRSEPLL